MNINNALFLSIQQRVAYSLHAGLIAKTFRTIFVEREKQGSRTKAVREIRRYANARGKWPQILIFPEGTILLYPICVHMSWPG